MSSAKLKPTLTETPRMGGGKASIKSEHPAFVTARFSRVQGHASLFDSNIGHDSFITLTVEPAYKVSDGYSEYIHNSVKPLIEVAFSESQFVSLITRFNIGAGTPGTLRYCRDGGVVDVPGIDSFESSAAKLLRIAMDIGERETEAVGDDVAALQAILASLPKKKQEEAQRILNHLSYTSKKNMEFGKEVLVEHAEKLVVAANREIEAKTEAYVRELGISKLSDLTAAIAADKANLPLLGDK